MKGDAVLCWNDTVCQSRNVVYAAQINVLKEELEASVILYQVQSLKSDKEVEH